MSDYQAARARVEEMLTWPAVRSGVLMVPVKDLRAILNPPRPTAEEVAAALAEKLAEVGGAYLSNDEAAQAVLALFTTPDPSS